MIKTRARDYFNYFKFLIIQLIGGWFVAMKLLISGGGTGGHISPAQAIINKWQENRGEVLYLGGIGSREEKIAQESGLNFQGLPVKPLPRKLSLALFSSLVANSRAFFQARRACKDFNPDIVVGTGGYTAGAVLLAAALAGYPTIIHEQNSYPGLTNRILARFVDRVALSFSSSKEFFSPGVADKLTVTGNPVRKSILAVDNKYKSSDNKNNSFEILVMGGSQGAVFINKLMLDIYPLLYEDKNVKDLREKINLKKGLDPVSGIKVRHITGKKNYQQVKEKLAKRLKPKRLKNISLVAYLTAMEEAYASADLIISRAGATTIAEITAVGLPAILIPYPHAADNHQLLNARELYHNQAAYIMEEDSLTADKLLEKIINLAADKKKLKAMAEAARDLGQPAAGDLFLAEIKELIRG